MQAAIAIPSSRPVCSCDCVAYPKPYFSSAVHIRLLIWCGQCGWPRTKCQISDFAIPICVTHSNLHKLARSRSIRIRFLCHRKRTKSPLNVERIGVNEFFICFQSFRFLTQLPTPQRYLPTKIKNVIYADRRRRRTKKENEVSSHQRFHASLNIALLLVLINQILRNGI